MTDKEMWKAYLSKHPEAKNTKYESWCYGSVPDKLTKLTLNGIKTATASAYPFYEYENSELPKADDYSIILWEDGTAACIIRTERVSVVPFLQVTAEHAYKEGEGNRSLTYWRRIHAEVFAEELTKIHKQFSDDMLVVCEEFKMIYPIGMESSTDN